MALFTSFGRQKEKTGKSPVADRSVDADAPAGTNVPADVDDHAGSDVLAVVDDHAGSDVPAVVDVPAGTEDTASAAMSDAAPGSLAALDGRVVDVIKTCYDPEIPVNIYDLGLIYQVRIKAHGAVHVTMTLTAPNCPAAQSLPTEVKEKIQNLPGVSEVEVEVVWDPPWSFDRMSEAARLELGFF